MKKKDRNFLYGIILASGLASGLPVAAVQLLADRHFQDGLKVIPPAGGAPEGVLENREPYGAALWGLAQWGSQESIYGAVPTSLTSGAMQWQNPYKAVVMGPTGSSDGDLVLSVDAITEYGGVYRNSSQYWPHLLVEQGISAPGNWFQSYGPSIDRLHEVILDLDLRLNYISSIYGPGYNTSLHAAQFSIFFTIQNLNPSATGYGDYLWFGLRFYDDRDPLPGPFIFGDSGTGGTDKLMYSIGATPFWSTGMETGVWKRATVDLLPHIKLSLEEAWSRGYLPGSSNVADYKIGSMNMGWEVPGLSDVSMQIRDVGLLAYGLDFAKPYEFNVDGESDGWQAVNMVDINAGALDGTWVLTPGDDPILNGPAMRLSADRYKQVVVRMANMGNPPGGSAAQLFWRRSGDAEFSESRSVKIPVSNNGSYDKYTFDMSSNPEWNGEIVQFRLDPIVSGDGQPVGVDYIRPVVESVVAGDGFNLKGDVSGGVDHILYWDGVPYQQYTLQQSTNLVDGAWEDVDGFVDVPFTGPLMETTLTESNRPAAGFYRLQASPGP